ncbi:hypothetical protein AB0F88_10945 [Streptosporangium sp. NPDC023963]
MSDFADFKSDPLYALVKRNVDQMPPLSPEKRARLALILQRGEADANAA